MPSPALNKKLSVLKFMATWHMELMKDWDILSFVQAMTSFWLVSLYIGSSLLRKMHQKEQNSSRATE
jgi:hypothetical protein